MTEWLDISARLGGHWIYVAAVPAAFLFIHLVYGRSRPPVSGPFRGLLQALRWAAVGTLLALVAEPVFALVSKRATRPRLLTLVDLSPSMAVVEEDGKKRISRALEVLHSADFQRMLSRTQVSYWGFAEDAIPAEVDTLSTATTGRATNLTSAISTSLLAAGDQSGLLGILLISDGGHNLGEDPVRWAQETGVPVFALAVGARDRYPADIQIASARLPDKGYSGRAVPLEVGLRSWGYEGRKVTLTVSEGEQILEERQVELVGKGQTQQIAIALKAQEAGPHIYRVSVEAVAGELTARNNQALAFTHILQDRIRVLVVAGGPGPELSFLQRTLAADSTLILKQRVYRDSRRLYGGEDSGLESDLQTADVIVLVDPGPELLDGNLGKTLKTHISRGGGLLWVGGPRSMGQWDANAAMASVLPVSLPPGAGLVPQVTPLALTVEGRAHPVVRPTHDQSYRTNSSRGTGTGVFSSRSGVAAATLADPWAGQMPPLHGRVPAVEVEARGAIVLIESADTDRTPVIVAGSHGRGRVIVALAAGFWRLDLLSSGSGDGPRPIRDLWRNAVKWLSVKEEPTGRVRAAAERHVYRGGEEVTVLAEVQDELMRPQEYAVVTASLSGGSRASANRASANRASADQVSVDQPWADRTIALSPVSPGRYRGQWPGLPEGAYSFTVNARIRDVAIGSDAGEFSVAATTVEAADLRADHELLRKIAAASQGAYHPLQEWAQLRERLTRPPRLVAENRQISLWGHWWICPLIIGFLATEWLARKRHGML